MKYKKAIVAFVFISLSLTPVMASTVTYEFEGTFALSSGNDTTFGLDNQGWAATLTIDMGATGTALSPTQTRYDTEIISSAFTINTGPSAGMFQISELFIIDGAASNTIQFVIDLPGSLFTAFVMSYDPSTWAGTGTTAPVGVGIPSSALLVLVIPTETNIYTATTTLASVTATAVPEPATLDIKPGSDPNSINCNNDREVISVAIMTTAIADGDASDFDATSVDHTTVSFEEASETHVDRRTGEPRRHEEDVDSDGDTDLVLHFRLGETGLTCESTEGTLQGETFDGTPIEGTDSVRMVESGPTVITVGQPIP